MKVTSKKELHTKSVIELTEELKNAREALRQLRLEKEMGRLKNTSELRQKRTEIAILQTIMHEKSVAEKQEDVVKKQAKEAKAGNTKVEDKKSKSASTKVSAGKEGGKKE